MTDAHASADGARRKLNRAEQAVGLRVTMLEHADGYFSCVWGPRW